MREFVKNSRVFQSFSKNYPQNSIWSPPANLLVEAPTWRLSGNISRLVLWTTSREYMLGYHSRAQAEHERISATQKWKVRGARKKDNQRRSPMLRPCMRILAAWMDLDAIPSAGDNHVSSSRLLRASASKLDV